MVGLRDRVTAEVGKVAVGQEDVVEQLLAALLVRSHVLLEGVPGVAKTLLANATARALGLPFRPRDTGYGHGSAQVAAVRVSAELLTAYHDETYERTVEYVSSVTDADLGRVVDRRWDPPVTLGVRLISVVSDDLQHAGQAAFVRGLLPPR